MLLGYFHVIVRSFHHEQEGHTESEKVSTIERERDRELNVCFGFVDKMFYEHGKNYGANSGNKLKFC